MEPHPLPDLHGKTLPLRSFQGRIFRMHNIGENPLYFGKRCLHRFDAPKHDFGVLYAAGDPAGAFIETLGHKTGRNIVQENDLRRRRIAVMETMRKLRLVDLRAECLARIGADARLCSGDYRVAQKWSEAFFHHATKPDGIFYPARHDPSKHSLALYDRARRVLKIMDSLDLFRDIPLLTNILNRYHFGLV